MITNVNHDSKYNERQRGKAEELQGIDIQTLRI